MRLKNFLPIPLLCMALSASAQDFPVSSDPDTVQAIRMGTPPLIDGTIDPQEWSGMTTSSRSLVVISTSQLSGDKGQYWIGYDDRYIYVAARIILDNGGAINADEFRQNVSLMGNDSVTFLLDAHGTSQQFNAFTFNASGATQMQIAGGRAAKQEWLGQFDTAGRITDTGWEGEARIAWSLMPLPNSGQRDMKFIFDWYVSSKQQGESFHSTNGNLTRMHVLEGIDVPKIDQSRKINFLPYAYGGIDDDGNYIANAGLDVKTALTDQLNFVTTINPDFRNIEDDILSLDFSNFERLADETRPFFVEGSSFLRTGQVNLRQLFAPQRIGTFDTGVNVYGVLSDNLQLGVLSTIDQGNQHTFATEVGFSPDPTSSINFGLAALDRPSEENYAGNLEYFKFAGDYLLFAQSMQSDDEITGKGSTLSFGTQYQSPGMRVVYMYEQVSPNFNPRIGFAPQRNFKGSAGVVEFSQSYSKGPLRDTRFSLHGSDQELFDGGHYREGVSTSAATTLKSGLAISLTANWDHFLDRHDSFYAASLTMPRNDPYRQWRVSHVTGEVANTRYNSTAVSFRYRPIKRLQLAGVYQRVDLFTETEQTIVSFNWEMDKWQSIGGRVVGLDDDWNWFASYSMRGNKGAEYFLIVGDPNADTFQSSVILKVSVPLAVGR